MQPLSPGEPALVPLLLLGLVLGLRHALDPDHLAAIAATVARYPGTGRAAVAGALWGLGHGAAVLVAGGLIVAFGIALPAWAPPLAEAAVGLILVGLGLDLLRALRRERIHLHVHEHDGQRHLHLHHHEAGSDHARVEAHRHDHPGRRALLVGLAHGLAGSAALALLVAAATPSRVTGILFLAVFGAGAAAAMALATAVIALPLRRPAPAASAAPGRGFLWLRAGGAVASIAVGVSMIASWLSG